uniref:Hypothetical chloroplast RF21 n=1 Tax=Selaginella erythropus TaxID=137146 RepID=A0A8K2ATD1_9TRAC|nr:hypothetical chloroplast RF21 [Selaginella erythropus]
MDEISFVEAGVQRYIEKRCRRGFRRVGGWTLGGSLIAIPSNRRGENIPDDPSHQLFILNSLVITLALPVLWKGCFGDRGARNKNRKPHPSVLERYIMCTVRTSQSECERGMDGKRFSFLADIFTNKLEESAQTAAKPTQNHVGESRTSRRGVSLIYLRDFGRSDDGYRRLFDVWATREYRNSRFGSSDYQCVELNTSPHNKCYEQTSYLITRTNRCICFPLQSAPRCAVRCCGRGYISQNDSIDRFRALLDWWSILLLKELSYNNWFVPQVHPATRYVSSGKDCVSVSIFGERHRLNTRYWTILPPSASLTDVGAAVGESEELLSAGIVREGFITSFKEAVSEYDFRITTDRVIGSTATNWRESSQSELDRIRLNLFNDFVKVLLRVGRNVFFCHHPETQIRICRMEYNGFHGGAVPHPLNRWGTTGEINHWLNDYRSRGDRYKYVDLHPNVVYEWSDRAGGSKVFARYSMPTRNHSMMAYARVGFTTGQGQICRRGYSMKYVKFFFICERLDLVIRGFKGGADDPPSPTNTIIFHLETMFGISGNHKPPQLPPDELDASSPKHDATVVGRCITDLPRRDEPDAECTGRRRATGGNKTTARPPGPAEYNRRFNPAKRRIETTGSLTCYREAKTTPRPRRSDRLRLLGRKRRLSPRNCHLACGVIENNSIAYRQSRKIFSVRFPPTFAAEHRRLILPDRDILSIIQSHISDYIMYPNHPPQARDRPFALARHACELFHFSSAQTNSLLLRGKTTVGPTRQSSITKSFRIKRMGNIGVITSCRPHACAEVLTPTKGSGCPAESRDGKGVSSSGGTMKGGQSRTDKGTGIQTQPEHTLDFMRASFAGASSTDFASLIVGRGLLAEESTALFDSFKDETYSPKKYPTPPRPNELVVDGTNICAADGDHNNAFGECNWFRADTPFLSTRNLWKYWDAIPETREKHASSKSNDRTNNMMNVRGFNIAQPSCRPTSQWPSRNSCNNEYPTMGSPPCALLVLVKGSSYIDPRRRLAVILFVLDASRKSRSDRWSALGGMIHNPLGGRQNDGFFLYPPTNIKFYVQNIGYFIRTRERTNERSYSSKSLDLYPAVKVILIECMMTDEHIYRNDFSFLYSHHLFNNDSGHRIVQEQGLYYSRYLARSYDNGIANYHIRHSDSRNLIYLALWQRVTPPNHTYRIPPVQVRSGLSSPSRGISPIASTETGRSYPMNDLAAYFDAHSIPISMSDFYEDKSGFTVDDIRMNGMKLLAASLCRLLPFLGRIDKKPPRIIWIRDMHELDFKGERFARAGIGIKLASRSLSILSAGFATCTQSMIVTGSTYPPGEIDPPLICANRSERLADVRALSIPRRKKEFPALLRSKRFGLLLGDDTFSYISAFGYIIMCDYARDSASPAHEALLIGMSHSVFLGHAIGSVPLGQVVPDHDVCMDTGSHYSDKYVYRAGRAVAHSTVIGILPTSPSSYGSEMKDPSSDIKLYSWSAWYLEPSIAESTAREFTRLLSRVSGSLAGSARRYSWPVADDHQRRYYSNNSVRSSAEYDSTSARSAASENIFAESPWLENTRKGESAGGEVGFGPRSQIITPPGTAWNAIFAVPSPPVLDEEGFGMTNDTTAHPAPRPGLLPAISNISDWVQTVYARGKRTLANHLMHDSVVHVLRNPLCYAHKRVSSSFQILSRMRKGAESQSESMLSTDRPVILGVYIPTGCRGCQQTNQTTLPMGKRFVWDGSLSIYRTFAAEFSHQSFMDQGELVSDQGGSMMPKGLHAVRRHKKGVCGGADRQFYARDTDDVVPPVAVAGQSTADDRSGIESESPDARRPSIDMLTRTNNIGFRSEHTHVFHPVYSYQARALFESPSDTFACSESPNHEIRWLGSQPQDPPAHSTLPETHRYSLKNIRVANTGCRCIKR